MPWCYCSRPSESMILTGYLLYHRTPSRNDYLRLMIPSKGLFKEICIDKCHHYRPKWWLIACLMPSCTNIVLLDTTEQTLMKRLNTQLHSFNALENNGYLYMHHINNLGHQWFRLWLVTWMVQVIIKTDAGILLTEPQRFQGLYLLRRRCLISNGIPIINLRQSCDRLRFIMEIPIPVRRHLLCE